MPNRFVEDVAQFLPRTRSDMIRYQQQQLRALLAYVWTHSPFYREYYSSNGIRDTHLSQLDVRDLPLVTKPTLMEHFDTVVTDGRLRKADLEHWLQNHRDPHQQFHKDFIVCYSSGSSGTVGIFAYDRPSWQVMSSVMALRLPVPERLGTGKTRVAFYLATHGHFIGVASTMQLSQAVYESLRLSIMDPFTQVIEQLQTFQPHRLVGYASSITALAESALEGRLHIRPSHVLVTAEPLTPSMARTIKAAWDVPLHISYSASESLYLGLQEAGEPELTLMDDLNIVEVLDAAQQPVAPGERGRVVLTNLYNRTLPIIRYELGDYAVRGSGQETSPFSTISDIEGKNAADLPTVMSDGTDGTIVAVSLSSFYVAGLHRVQFTSLRPDQVRIEYIAPSDLDEAVRQEFQRILAIKGAHCAMLEVQRVPYLLPDPKTGKVPLVKVEQWSRPSTAVAIEPAPRVTPPQPRRVGPTNTFIPFPKAAIEQSIPARFEQQVVRYPTRIAIKTGPNILTYDALNRRANQLAHTILEQQPVSNNPVALLLDHGAPAITALLSVLKTGRSYVPLDPMAPQARLKRLLDETQVRLMITDNKYADLAATLVPSGCRVLNTDYIGTTVADENLGLAIAADALAYILYTSGSTGQPKGVMQNHRNVLHSLMKYTNGSHICADDRLSLLFSVNYSAAVTNIFGALLNGAALFPFDLKEVGLRDLVDWLIREEITVYHSVTTVFRYLLDVLTGEEAFPKLRLIELTGEPVSPRDVEGFKRHFSQPCLLHNRMAATEMSLIRQYFIDQKTLITGGTVPVGYAVADTEILLLDEEGEAVGVNQIGEIVIKSPYLALGYWRKPDLTQAAFMPDPAGGSMRLYRTGDLGRLRPDGCLEHLGRKDTQVKIRGHRVETSEVETVLREHPAVKEIAVLAREDSRGDKSLVAYVVPARQPAPTVGELRSVVQVKLPDYMVPSAFVLLEVLPLLPNGKVDRQALPMPDQARPELDRAFIAPRTPLEEVLAGIWMQVLGLAQVGIHDNFLELGGHSLSATQVVSRIRTALQLDLPLRTLFEAPTVAGLASFIAQGQERVSVQTDS